MPSIDPRSPERLKRLFEETEAVLITAGNGFSRLEKFDPLTSPRWFRHHFRDLRARHKLHSIAHGIMFPYPARTMEWAFMGRLIALLSSRQPMSEPMKAVALMAAQRPLFVATTSADGSFRTAGIGDERLFEMAGNLHFMHCRWLCNDAVFPVEDAVRTMLAPGLTPTIAPEHIPRCPRCNAPMTSTIARDLRFMERPDWAMGYYRLLSFLRSHSSKRLLIIELGVSPWNAWLKSIAIHAADRNPLAQYLQVNDQSSYLPPRLYDRTLQLEHGIVEALSSLLGIETAE